MCGKVNKQMDTGSIPPASLFTFIYFFSFIYEYGTGNQCTVTNINITAWQIKREKRKCGGDGVGNDNKI